MEIGLIRIHSISNDFKNAARLSGQCRLKSRFLCNGSTVCSVRKNYGKMLTKSRCCGIIEIIYNFLLWGHCRKMGECRIYKCACGYQKRLMIGAGRGAHSLDIASRTVPADIAVLLCDENGESRFTLSNSVISCGGCKELSTVTDLKYELEGKPVRYVSECPVCGKRMIR